MTSTAHPLPALPIVAEHSYLITFTVTGSTEYAAIEAAVTMLRTGVRLIGVHEVTRATPTHWRVTLKVAEDSDG